VKQQWLGLAFVGRLRAKSFGLLGVVALTAGLQYPVSGLAQQPAMPVAPAVKGTLPVHSELPAGEGKDTVMKVCSKCHSPNLILANPMNRQGWEDIITKMSGMGAMATDDEFTTILEYLAKNIIPPINVNKAPTAILISDLALTGKEADAVVAYRTKNGDFKSLDDLKKIPDVDGKKLDDKKDHIVF
jgi:competence protein ComEA